MARSDLWHALTHGSKEVAGAIIETVIEEVAADHVCEKMIHKGLLAEARARRG